MHATSAAESPAALARRFQRSCGAAPMVTTRHAVAVIASEARGLMYLTNVKVGSQSMRAFLRGIDSDWITGPAWSSGVCTNASEKLFVLGATPACLECIGICPCPRTTTACYAEARLAGLLRFSFVRDPVTKFESGAEQMRFGDKAYANTSTDAILELQLRMHADAAPGS